MAIRGASTTLAGMSLIPTSLGFGVGSIFFGHFFVKHSGSYYWFVCFPRPGAEGSIFTDNIFFF